MKTRLLCCIVVIGLLPAFRKNGGNSTATVSLPVKYRSSSPAFQKAPVLHKQGVIRSKKHPAKAINRPAAKPAALDSITKLLRLKLYIDQYNYDDIAIGFNSGATAAYDFNEDSKYMPGIDAPEGLCCFSSDGVPLSINLLPLPKQAADVIRLDVEAQNSGPITLKRTELDSLPKIYNIWLIDHYKKDSINLRTDSNYVFTINKNDTATFGAWRFKVVVSNTPPPPFQLVDFNAVKAPGGAEVSWVTQNERNDTRFCVERSSDGGITFGALDSLVSSSAGRYSFTDNAPPATTDEYRMKVTDANGVTSYSNVVTLLYSVSAPALMGAINVFPNPTNGMINLTINQNDNSAPNLAVQSAAPLLASPVSNTTSYNIRIVNISGTTIRSATSSTGSWQDNVSTLSAGTYIITVVNTGTNKLVGRSTFVKL